MVHILGQENTILNKFIAQIRDSRIQLDSMRFRRNMERIGEIMSYEISKALSYTTCTVETPLGESQMSLVSDKIVIATVLRAGLPLHQGFLNYFDNAQSAFVAAYRKNSKDGTFKVKVEYVSSCDLEGKVLLLVDPMLATGTSLVLTYEAMIVADDEGIRVRELAPIPMAEDFGYYSTRYASLFYRLGVGTEAGMAHTESFSPNEEAIAIGERLMRRLALHILNK